MDELNLQSYKRQYDEYIGWINKNLKKDPSIKLISNLEKDLNNGVIISQLINILAGEIVSDIIKNPINEDEKIHNIETVLSFISKKKIPIHKIKPIDIVSGEMKPIMRLILALAAAYKPSSIRSHSNNNSIISIAQSASIALAETRRLSATSIPRPMKPQQLFECLEDFSIKEKPEIPFSHINENMTDVHSIVQNYNVLLDNYSNLLNDYVNMQQYCIYVTTQMKHIKLSILDLQKLINNGP